MMILSNFIPGTCENNKCLANSLLPLGSQIASLNKKYTLRMLTDGNLVIKCNNGIIWSTYTSNKGVAVMHFQKDGNVVLRTNNGSIVWQTEKKGEELKMQNEGNLVLYKMGNVSVWNAGTNSKCSGRKRYSS